MRDTDSYLAKKLKELHLNANAALIAHDHDVMHAPRFAKKCKNCRCYSNKEILLGEISLQKPLSGFNIKVNGSVVVTLLCYKLSRGKIGLLKAVFNDTKGCLYFGAWHSQTTFDDVSKVDQMLWKLNDLNDIAKVAIDYVAFHHIPPNSGQTNKGLYYVHTKNWLTRTKDSLFALPNICENDFNY